MHSKVAVAAIASKGTPGVLAIDAEDTHGVPLYRLVRSAVDATDWKIEALAEHMGLDRPYLSKMLAGEKPWGAKHLRALPDDVEALFVRFYAEQFGFIVVQRVDESTAKQQLASALFNLLAPAASLPARAGAPAKAELAPMAMKGIA